MKSLSLGTHADGLIGRLVLAACIVLVLAVLPQTAATAAISPDGWGTQTSDTTWTLYGVWGTASADVFAVGENGTILHYDGASWNSMDSGVSVALFDVWGCSSTDVFVVGQNGVICHYDGTGWSEMSSGTSKHLKGVWGTATDNVYAVGNSGTILNYNGTSWDNVTSNTSTHLNGIWGSCSTDVFAVGATGINGLIMHYDGATWSPSPATGHPDFLAIWGAASDNVFVVGGQGTILRYDGASWNAMTTPVASVLNGVWGVSPTDVFAVGAAGRVLHYDGNVGNVWSLMDSGVSDDICSVWGLSSLNVFATGQNGAILHYKEMPPEVSAVSPNQGNQGQTLDVTISGSNLDTATSVSFGSGVLVNSYHADSASQITAKITIEAAASAGARNVSVTTPSGTDTLDGAFTIPPASIASVGPSSGKQGQALDVAILGANLSGTTSVAFGDGITVASFAVQSPDRVSASITISVSASIGTRDVTISTVDGPAVLQNAFSVTEQAPTIAAVNPRSGKIGQALSLSITGANLGGATGVSLGAGIVVEGFVATPDQITVSVVISGDASLGVRSVSVTAAGGTATLDGGFVVYRLPPGVVGVSPASGKPGQTLDIVISGVNFTGTTSVDFGPGVKVNSFRVDSDMQITANITVLEGAEEGLRDVQITTAVGSVSFPSGFDLDVGNSSGPSSLGPSSGGSSGWWWLPVLLGGFVAAISLFILLLMRRKKDGTKERPSTP